MANSISKIIYNQIEIEIMVDWPKSFDGQNILMNICI